MMKKLLGILLIVTLFSCNDQMNTKRPQMQEEFPRPNVNQGSPGGKFIGEPGFCYAKCIYNAYYINDTITLPIFNGQDINAPNVEEKMVIIKPMGKEMTKTKYKEGCTNLIPEKCLIWEAIEIPEVTKSYTIVNDTSINKDYTLQRIPVKRLIDEGGYTAWNKVVCNNNITPTLITNLKSKLTEKGYRCDLVQSKVLSQESKKRLMEYQKDNNLPIGNLDFETMRSLDFKGY